MHRTLSEVDTSHKDPKEYVREIEEDRGEDDNPGSLRIGSLKGR